LGTEAVTARRDDLYAKLSLPDLLLEGLHYLFGAMSPATCHTDPDTDFVLVSLSLQSFPQILKVFDVVDSL
jgi:hypothetical protein